jgi:hypothetical protein
MFAANQLPGEIAAFYLDVEILSAIKIKEAGEGGFRFSIVFSDEKQIDDAFASSR